MSDALLKENEDLKKQVEDLQKNIELYKLIVERQKALTAEYFNANMNFNTNNIVAQYQMAELTKNLQEAKQKIDELSKPILVEQVNGCVE